MRRARLIIWAKETVFYLLVALPLVVLDVWLLLPRSHVAGYVVEGFIILGALLAQGRLQRRFWP